MSAGVRAFCIGFIGTGSVPANGTASTVTFVMSTPSSIQWLWEERYEVIVENPAGFGEPNPVAGTYFVSPGQEFTASNTDYFGPYALLGYILVTEGGSDVNSGQTVTITVTEPIRVVWEWNFVPVSWQPALPVATGAGQVPFYVDMERSPVTSSPWICYQDLTSKDLHAAFYSVDQWVNLTLDSFGDVGAFSNLKVSPEGDIYIAYYDETNRILKVAERIGGVWAISVVDDNAGNGRFCSINISPEGKIGISYLDNSDLARPKIKYAQKFQNDWIVETCREFSGVVEYLSLVYVNEQPMIAFYDATAGLLRYMYFDLEWIMDTIDGIPDVGRFCNAGVNPTTGRPEVVYYDLANRSLKYARRLPDFTWDIQTVDATGDVGYYPNISFDNNGKPNICYQDLGQQRLRFATFDGINWQLSTIAESTGNTNWFPALAKYLEQEFSVVYLDNSQMRYLSSQKFVDMNDFVVGKGGGCFVATAAFGTMASDSVRALTGTRDALLSASCTGASVLELYYSSSVSATRAETSSAALRAIVREWLMPFSR